MSKLPPIPELEITINRDDLDLPRELQPETKTSETARSVKFIKFQPLDINTEIYQWILHLVKCKSAQIKILRAATEKLSPRKLVQSIVDAQSFTTPPETAETFAAFEQLQKTARNIVIINKMLTFVKELANEKDFMSEAQKDFNDSVPLPKIFGMTEEESDASTSFVPYFSLKQYMLAKYKTDFSLTNPEFLYNGELSNTKNADLYGVVDTGNFTDAGYFAEINSIHYSDVTFLMIDNMIFKLRPELWPVFQFIGIPCIDKRNEKADPSDWTQTYKPEKLFVRIDEGPILCIKCEDKIFTTYENFDIERLNFIGIVFLSHLLSISNLNDLTINYEQLIKKIINSRTVRPIM